MEYQLSQHYLARNPVQQTNPHVALSGISGLRVVPLSYPAEPMTSLSIEIHIYIYIYTRVSLRFLQHPLLRCRLPFLYFSTAEQN
jgi:hypothetical protein